jgi:crotonobetainyl-CoA:carnitine CoA-transferase CaiB-like acyl-CoA transferase
MKALEGIRVLDLGGFITGPFAALLLAELGADVIKVEWPGKGDKFRADGRGLYSSQFQAHNRDKRSVTLDYSQPAGREVLLALVRSADVLVSNSRPGVMEKLGVDYEALRQVNPRLIYCAITGFGADGPYAQRPAFDNVGQALSGWMSRHRRGDDPRVAGPAIADPVTSLYAALGVLSALIERARSGRGRLVEVNMLEAMIGLAIEPITSFFTLRQPIPVFERAATSQAYNLTCKDGKRIGLHASMLDKFWQGLCRAIEREDWTAKYPRRADRIADYENLAVELSAIFRTLDRSEWIARLERAVVPFGAENELQDLENDPQIRHLEVFYEAAHPRHGKVKAPRRPVRIDGSRDIDFRPPPDLGEHTDEVLGEIGLTAERIAQLREARVI